MKLISSEDLFFNEHHDFRTKFGFLPKISDNLLEYQDLGKCHTKFGKNFIAPEIFCAGTGMQLVTKSPQQ